MWRGELYKPSETCHTKSPGHAVNGRAGIVQSV